MYSDAKKAAKNYSLTYYFDLVDSNFLKEKIVLHKYRKIKNMIIRYYFSYIRKIKWSSKTYVPVGIPVTLHRGSELLNIPVGHKLSDIEPNGGNPWDGNKAPGVRKTFVVFFRFFHFALRFWNQTYEIRGKLKLD